MKILNETIKNNSMGLIRRIKDYASIFSKTRNIENQILEMRQIDKNRFECLSNLIGKMHVERIKQTKNISSLQEIEFKVYSQFGEDGIIQYLINNIEIPNKYFIEFGVENYLESNTRFLLMNDNWNGLVIDGSEKNIEFIKNDRLFYKHNLIAIHSFITKENINEIIKKQFDNLDDIGLINIDIDGNDYWVWNEISVVRPRIVVCEYNSLFGYEHQVTIPYQSDFSVLKAHYSCLYYGASIAALCKVANEKGYYFVGCDSEGVDAFFVRKDLSGSFKICSAQEGFVKGKFRISRDINGKLTYLTREDAIKCIGELKLYDLNSDKLVTIEDLKLS